MARFVLEIGTEELPPRFFAPALSQLRSSGEGMLRGARLSFSRVTVYGAPRRLAFIAENLSEQQAPATREERGPPARAAYDADGNPTRAALGFARRHGVAPETLVVRKDDQGEYVYAVIREPEAPAGEALAARLPSLIAGLSFPKMMRWGSGSLRFGRPIRWLLSLLDDQVVSFELDGIRSGARTRGHPTLADGMFALACAQAYEGALRERFVIVDPEVRRAAIDQQLQEAAQAADARVVDGGLLEETTFLVEWPTAARGGFDPAFLRLPRPVLVEEMQHVQSYFPLEDQRGSLLPQFIAVRDGGADHLDTVVSGWESVLRAKLIDASYFFHEDLKRPLADRVDDLRGVVFQEQLGTMYDKVQRVRRAAAALAQQIGLEAGKREALDRAALLCKADLTTMMVGELPRLQGTMGCEYALASGEAPDVAKAIGEHYRPRFAGDEVPATTLGRLLAVADKADTIAACFSAGLLPTGSADPYGLRREATGVVAIVLAMNVSISIGRLLDACLRELGEQQRLPRPAPEARAAALEFLRQRLATYLRDAPPAGAGVRYDLVEAALAVGFDDLRDAAERAKALQMLADSEPEFLPIVIASTRASNIARGFDGGAPDERLFEHEAERALWEAYKQLLPTVDQQTEVSDYVALFRTLGRLRGPIDRYFDDVLVMTEDERLRRNRLATCWTINQLFRRIADFSLVVQS